MQRHAPRKAAWHECDRCVAGLWLALLPVDEPMDTKDATGLTSAQAAQRRHADGPNDLPGRQSASLPATVLRTLAEPMFLLLMAAAAIYMVLGEQREAIALSISLVVVTGITIVQERRTERALARLQDLSSPRALVIRDGAEQRIPGCEVVRGDLILLREGDRVPADALLCSATGLSVDESILTGESLPVDKQPGADTEAGHSHVYAGTLIVRGFGTAQVTATGTRSELGKIGKALAEQSTPTTPLLLEIRHLVRWVAVAGLLLCGFVAVVYGASSHSWLAGLLAGITLAMSLIPEEFPVVLTVFLAMGAWRISRVGVLTRRMPAIEAIGAVTLLAVDKTGTLTENRMQVVLIETFGAQSDLSQPLDAETAAVLDAALAASERDAFDPMERAIHEAAARSIPECATRAQQELVREYDMTPDLPAVTHAWGTGGATELDVSMKGAPETVIRLAMADEATRGKFLASAAAHAGRGLRVLAVARGTCSATALPERAADFQLQLIGLVGLADPLRQDVPQALNDCRQAGIRVVMITGDHPGTAAAIATQAGMDTGAGVLTGAELESLPAAELASRARGVNVFARMKPAHKLRLLQAFKDNGDIVAMTGDGVNDAPALRAAHVGVAMGGRGTDVAREAAALVLANDSFGSLVACVRLGRRIYANIRHAMSYIVAVHISIAGLGLLPVLFGWPLLFYPLHILFLEFIIDPACAFVFEADSERPDIMRQPPRAPHERLFTRGVLRRSVLLGALVLLLSCVIYRVGLQFASTEMARTLAFVSLALANLALIFVSRSRSETLGRIAAKPNAIFWWITGLASAALLSTVYLPPVAAIFQFSPPSLVPLVAVAATAVISVLLGGHLLKRDEDTA